MQRTQNRVATLARGCGSVPGRGELESRGRRLRVGETLDLDELGVWLVANGYKRVDACELPGEFARRGGMIPEELIAAATHIRDAHPGDNIAIVVGSSTHATHRLVGSAAVSLARHSPVPVGIVP